MTIETTWIGIILLLIFTGPVIYLLYKQKTKERNQVKTLKNLCDLNNLFPDFNEISGACMLGLDTKVGKLIYLRTGESGKYKLIDLNEFSGCKLEYVETTKSYKEYIGLRLHHKRQHAVHEEIIFYEDSKDTHLDSGVQFIIAKKWHGIIQQHLLKI